MNKKAQLFGLELDPKVLLVSCIFFLIIEVMLWKFTATTELVGVKMKILISICALPVTYACVNWQLNK